MLRGAAAERTSPLRSPWRGKRARSLSARVSPGSADPAGRSAPRLQCARDQLRGAWLPRLFLQLGANA